MTVLLTPSGNRIGLKEDPLAGGHPERSRWSGSGSVQLVGVNLYATYAGLYRTQPWLAAAVNKISKGIARLPLFAYTTSAEGNPERLRDHPLVNVLRKPAGKMSPFRWKQWLLADLALYGNSIAYVVAPPNGEIQEIWPAPWPLIEVKGRRDPEVYIYHSPIGPIPFDADRALHLRYWSPISHQDPLVGVSPVEPLRRSLMNEDAAGRWSTAIFSNAGRPSGAVTTDKTMNRTQVDLVRDELQQIYGGVDNAFRIAVMHSGLKWEPLSFSAIDAALVDLRKLHREEVAGAYDMPPPMIQILDKATFSNIDEQHRMLYQDTLPPWMTVFEEEFYVQVLAQVWPEIFLNFDLGDVLQGDIEKRANAYSQLRRIYTDNELRAKEGLPRIDSPLADTLWKPINEYPISEGTPQPGKGPPIAILMNALDRAERYAASKVGAGQNGFEPDRFARELCQDLDRSDEAVKSWAKSIAGLVADTIHGADSPEILRESMSRLRASLVAPIGKEAK